MIMFMRQIWENIFSAIAGDKKPIIHIGSQSENEKTLLLVLRCVWNNQSSLATETITHVYAAIALQLSSAVWE